jgi:lipopolysaccharide transport system permease protein
MTQESDIPELIIRPKKHLLDINLKEIWHYRDLIMLMVRRDFVATYKQTVLGPLWYIITPLVNVVVFTFIFNTIANISTEGVPPILFYLSGLTLWSYFSTALNGVSNTFVNNAGIFGKVYFPRLVIPLSLMISSMIKFAIQFGLMIIIMAIYYFKGFHFHLSLYTLLVPVIFIMTAIFALACGIIISSLTTKYRDFQYLLGFGISLWMYITPIIYPVSIIPKAFRWMVLINPMAPLIEAFKYGLIGVGTVNTTSLIVSFISTGILLLFGVIIFNKVEGSFMDTV